MRDVAARAGMSVGAVAYWVAHARGKRLDRVSFASRKPGRAWNRTASEAELLVLAERAQLRDSSILGEYGADAIALALHARSPGRSVPSRATINRILARHGALDAARRQRRPAPPKGWYLPMVASADAELDCFDFIDDLKIATGPLVSVLTGISLHGALADAWITPQPRATGVVEALIARFRRDGLPVYAQFDNDTLFQGAHQFAHTVGRVTRLCLALGITPVFAPPREPGFQNAIEGFNGLWQSKVWARYHFPNLQTLRTISDAYISAHRAKTAHRRHDAPVRRSVPRDFRLDLRAPLTGTTIFLRRTDPNGTVHMLGTPFAVDKHWIHRLVRCEVDFSHQRIRFFALRRRDPSDQRLLRESTYDRPNRPFQGTP
jgi:hypothetical protein